MESFVNVVTTVNNAVNSVVWGVPALILLVGTGFVMTFLTKFFQFTHFSHWMSETIGKLFSKIKPLRGIAGSLLAVALGAIIYYLVIQVVIWMGLNTNDLKMLTALVVAMFLAFPYWKSKLASRKAMKAAMKGGK